MRYTHITETLLKVNKGTKGSLKGEKKGNNKGKYTLKLSYFHTYVEGEGDGGMFMVFSCGALIALKNEW